MLELTTDEKAAMAPGHSMRLPSVIAMLLIAGVCHAGELYVEPEAGPHMTVDNMKCRKRLLGTDWYCVRNIVIDGKKVFSGNKCRVKHGEKHAVRLAPGKHRIVLDTISEWSNDDPDLPPINFKFDAEAGEKDFVVSLKDALEPEIVFLESGDKALMSPPAVSTASAQAAAEPAGDPFKALERLKELYDKGVITVEEFKAKKAELLKTIR